MYNQFEIFCENLKVTNNLLEVCAIAAKKGFTSSKFVREILEPTYNEEWESTYEFVSMLNTRTILLHESTTDQIRQLSPELKELRYGSIIRATKASFEKLIDKLNYKAAVDMDATGDDLDSMKKRQMITQLYKKLKKTVEDFEPVINVLNPQDRDKLKEMVKKTQEEFERGVMPYINEFLKTNIDPKYDSYEVIMAKIQGSRELGIRKLGGVAKDALSRKIYALLRKEGLEPVYKRKIELLARAIGAEPQSLEQIRSARTSADTDARRAESERRAAELDDARARGDMRFNPDLDKALGIE
jgi:hypothetical protein